MAANDGRLLGLYDEMSSFLGKLNLCRGKGICDSHKLAVFLELYNANAWSRSTGNASEESCKINSDFFNTYSQLMETPILICPEQALLFVVLTNLHLLAF